MGMDKSFIDRIAELSAENGETEIGGITYTTKEVHAVHPPTPACLTVHTLGAIRDYCLGFWDSDMADGEYFIRVDDAETVTVCSTLDKSHQTRKHFIKAVLIPDQFRFGFHLPVEEFVIGMQAMFVQDENTSAILKIVGNITVDTEHKTLDDGVSQSVAARTGIAKVSNVVLPNPVVLRPYRTFPEVTQPASKFVLRINAKPGEKPTCALYEADGGAWKIEAIEAVKEWLSDAITGAIVLA